MSIPVQILICPWEQIGNADETILSLGRQFADQYGFCIPDKIVRPANAKPCFAGSEIFFSVSHSGSYWTCAVSNAQLGIDLQRYQTCRMEWIAKRFFHPNEAAWIKDRGQEAFFLVWTAKESYVKFTGEGITDDFAAFSVVDDKGNMNVCNHAVLQHIPFQENYALCICTPEKADVKIIDQEKQRA
ncbi:MAG: 4'-phosphopantetheinyl transferase superfamily protein [Clostridiales bacterium]|nr:4'-phosphopantetheinyl transferase superfamily protein [Clostridiales bacterium]